MLTLSEGSEEEKGPFFTAKSNSIKITATSYSAAAKAGQLFAVNARAQFPIIVRNAPSKYEGGSSDDVLSMSTHACLLFCFYNSSVIHPSEGAEAERLFYSLGLSLGKSIQRTLLRLLHWMMRAGCGWVHRQTLPAHAVRRTLTPTFFLDLSFLKTMISPIDQKNFALQGISSPFKSGFKTTIASKGIAYSLNRWRIHWEIGSHVKTSSSSIIEKRREGLSNVRILPSVHGYLLSGLLAASSSS
ncbi:hypothetical protein KQX54_012095 [Cotesia glomerata]|uniref:Uncharacterized protein n=1 Tax=Cotesia glomerata TaxID=32391 RepID=A0AAV7J3B8_COTGL|nr:hypothetical protein KQX54_012095 [Cotesia glomerata]